MGMKDLFKGLKEQKSFDKTHEYAQPIEWKPQWDIGAPIPQVFASDIKTFLVYIMEESEQNTPSDSIVIKTTGGHVFDLALVEFINATAHRFGICNDEALAGHPLYDKGLEFFSAHEIINSTWIEEIKAIHKSHPQFNESMWTKKKHYMLLFKDNLFEVIAHDFKIETYKSTFQDLANIAAGQLH